MALMGKTKQAKFYEYKKPDKKRVERPASLQDLIEVYRVCPNGIFQVTKDKYSKVYLIEDVNYENKIQEEQILFFGEWCRTLNSFDMEFVITFFNYNQDKAFVTEKILYKHKDDGFNDARDCYNDIMETKIIDGNDGIELGVFLTITTKKRNFEEAQAAINDLESNCKKELNNLGSNLTPLSAEERMKYLYYFFRSGEEEKYKLNIEECILQGDDWKDEIAGEWMDFSDSHPDYFISNDKYGKAMYISPDRYGSTLKDTFIRELASEIKKFSIFSINYIPISKDIAKKVITDKYMGVQKEIGEQQRKRNKAKNFQSEISYLLRQKEKEFEEMLDDINGKDQKFYWVGINMVALADSKEDLASIESSIKQKCEKENCVAAVHRSWQLEGLNTCLLYGVRQNDLMRAFFTNTAAIFIPFKVQNIFEINDDYKPMYYGVNSVSKRAILTHRKNLLNGNGFVFGVPGSGKSFTGSKMEIGSVYLNSDDEIIVIDPTLEYEDVAKAFRGNYLYFHQSSKNHLNPLHVDPSKINVDDSNGIILEKCDLMASICEVAMEGLMTPGQKSIADRCTRNLFTKIAKLPLSDRKIPIMSDYVAELKIQKEQLEIEDMVLAFEKFTSGSLNIFNHQSNSDVNNRLTIFGIRNLSKNLSPIAMLIMMETVKNKVIENFKKGKTTWVYIDEFHNLTKSSHTKDFTIYLWKEMRKFGGMCTGLTQNPIDLLKDEDTQTIVSNSEYTLFMKMNKKDADCVLDTFDNISAAQQRFILNAQKGTGLIRFGDKIIPMDNAIDKSNPIYDIFNTNAHEKAKKREEDAVYE